MLVKSTRLLPAAEEGSVGFWSPVCEREKRPKAHHQPDTSASGNLIAAPEVLSTRCACSSKFQQRDRIAHLEGGDPNRKTGVWHRLKTQTSGRCVRLTNTTLPKKLSSRYQRRKLWRVTEC